MMQISDLALALVPVGLQATAVMIDQDRIVVTARTIGTVATCPTCGTGSDHVHSRYWRTIADLSWQGRQIVLQLQVRRFRCRHRGSRIFAERLPEIARNGRRAGRLALSQAQIGLVLGGEAGARLASKLAKPVSGDTVLRLIRKRGASGEAACERRTACLRRGRSPCGIDGGAIAARHSAGGSHTPHHRRRSDTPGARSFPASGSPQRPSQLPCPTSAARSPATACAPRR